MDAIKPVTDFIDKVFNPNDIYDYIRFIGISIFIIVVIWVVPNLFTISESFLEITSRIQKIIYFIFVILIIVLLGFIINKFMENGLNYLRINKDKDKDNIGIKLLSVFFEKTVLGYVKYLLLTILVSVLLIYTPKLIPISESLLDISSKFFKLIFIFAVAFIAILSVLIVNALLNNLFKNFLENKESDYLTKTPEMIY